MSTIDPKSFSDPEWLQRNPFGALSTIASCVDENENEARECLIRMLEHREILSGYDHIIDSLIQRVGLPTILPRLEVGDIIQAITHDKKVLRGKVRFILPQSLGKVFIADEVSLSLVEKILVDWHEAT